MRLEIDLEPGGGIGTFGSSRFSHCLKFFCQVLLVRDLREVVICTILAPYCL